MALNIWIKLIFWLSFNGSNQDFLIELTIYLLHFQVISVKHLAYQMSLVHAILVITVRLAHKFQVHVIISQGMFVIVVIIARSEHQTQSNVRLEHFPIHYKIRT